MYKISVIVPTYNVEKYLTQCLESIKFQTYSNIEVIIIIDGATDNSYHLAKKFCMSDDRFSVYWQENAGSGPARNAGLKKATGDYIAFVDPDDFLIPNYLEMLLNAMLVNDVDFVTSKYRTLYTYDNGSVARKSEVEVNGEYRFVPIQSADIVVKGIQNVRDKFPWLIINNYIDSPHCKLFKREIIKNNNLLFPDLRRSQDIVFNMRHFEHISSFCVMGQKAYVYRIVDGQMAKRIPPYYYKIYIEISAKRHQLLEKWKIQYDKVAFASYEFSYILAILLGVYRQKEACLDFIQDPHVLSIVKIANPKTRLHKIIKKNVLSANYSKLKVLFRIIEFKNQTKKKVKASINLFLPESKNI